MELSVDNTMSMTAYTAAKKIQAHLVAEYGVDASDVLILTRTGERTIQAYGWHTGDEALAQVVLEGAYEWPMEHEWCAIIGRDFHAEPATGFALTIYPN